MITSLRLNKVPYDILLDDKFAILIGEDIKDPYGGAFKITKTYQKSFLIK